MLLLAAAFITTTPETLLECCRRSEALGLSPSEMLAAGNAERVTAPLLAGAAADVDEETGDAMR